MAKKTLKTKKIIKLKIKAKTAKVQPSEIIDMIDEDDNVIGTMTREEGSKSNLLRRGVLVMIFDADGRLFVQQRLKTKKKYPSYWTVSCCGTVKSEEAYHDAAERELKEELYINAPSDYVCKFRYKDDLYNTFGHLFAMQYELPIKMNKDDVQNGKFVTEDEMKKMILQNKFVPESKAIIIKFYKLAKELAMQ